MGPEPMETNTSNQIEQILLKNKEYHDLCSFLRSPLQIKIASEGVM